MMLRWRNKQNIFPLPFAVIYVRLTSLTYQYRNYSKLRGIPSQPSAYINSLFFRPCNSIITWVVGVNVISIRVIEIKKHLIIELFFINGCVIIPDLP